MKSPLEKEWLLTLNLFQNQFDVNDQSEDRPRKKIMLELLSFGEDIAIRALKRYRMTTKSPFLSYPEIISCVKYEISKDMGMYDSKEAWGRLTEALRIVADQPKMPPVLERSINAIGGWQYLKTSQNQMADRSQFYKAYNTIYDEYLTGLLLEKTS